MKAVRLLSRGNVGLVDVPSIALGQGEVRLEVLAVGMCHTDLHIISSATTSATVPPFTLGHEVVGRVIEIGPEAPGEMLGGEFLVYAPWGCDGCVRCDTGERNYCHRVTPDRTGVGLGTDGGMADEVVVASHRLVSTRGIEATMAAPLADAALTTWHAISRLRLNLGSPSNVLVIGAGGLGHIAVQLLAARDDTSVDVLELSDAARGLATELGARSAFGSATALLASGRRYEAVLDFVGTSDTLAAAVQVAQRDSDLQLIGSGGGELIVTKPHVLPPGIRVSLPYWGTRDELHAVIDACLRGEIVPHSTIYPLSAALEAFDDLKQGRVTGRAVLVPDRILAGRTDPSARSAFPR